MDAPNAAKTPRFGAREARDTLPDMARLPNILHNTERSLEEGDIDSIIALDAAEGGHKSAHTLLAGTKATISIGSDSYPAKIVSATKSLSTVVAEYTSPGLRGDRMTFRKTSRGYRAKKHFILTFGFAETHMDPSF